MRENNVFIIIVNYKNCEDTKECVKSLINIYKIGYSIVIVDNASNDGSVQKLKNEFEKKVIIIENTVNQGFGVASNNGAKYAIEAGATHILLLNNDTTVDSNFLICLLKKVQDNRICVPKILSYYDKDKIWYAGGQIDRMRGTSRHFGMWEEDAPIYSIEKKVDYLSGCCVLIPVPIIKKIGLFGDEFFLYFEDMDFSLRCLEANVEILYVPEAIVYHKEGTSSGGKQSKTTVYYANRNRFYILKKYRNEFRFIARAYTYVSRLIYYIYGVIFRNNNRLIWKAYIDFKYNKMGKADL